MICFMSDILDLAHKRNIKSDLLHCMIAKISKRVRKLGKDHGTLWQRSVETVLFSALALMEGRWHKIMEESADHTVTARLEHLSAASNIEISLPILDDYIEQLRSRKCETSLQTFNPTSILVQNKPNSLPSLEVEAMHSHSATCRLADIENWVEKELDSWLSTRLLSVKTCASLELFIEQYHATASSQYHDNPEALSIMFLTILELWVACDKSVTNLHPMLKAHDPAINRKLLQSLLLPLSDQMQRLSKVETYLTDRCDQSQYSPPIWSDFGCRNSIGARFFDESPHHRLLLAQIQQDASFKRQKKVDELSRMKAEYSHLMELYNTSPCDFDQVYSSQTGKASDVHRNTCLRCTYLNRARKMEINVYQWPLPEDTDAMKCTIFEISVPQAISSWRDTTMFLNINVLLSSYDQVKRPARSYAPDRCLQKYIVNLGNRLSLVSEGKPFTLSHYRSKKVSIATESSICVNNGLAYRYYDSNQKLFVCETTMTNRVPKMCTYQLPSSTSCLQEFIFRQPGHTSGSSPNMVISTQSVCPDHMKLEEYRALATLPTGYRIQWANILVQLFAPSIDFKRIETSLMILQATRQVGPSSEGQAVRPSHVEPCDEIFAKSFLQGLQEGLLRTKENWESSNALGTLISLACRILTLSPLTEVQVEYLRFLSACRTTAFKWTRHLRDRAHQAQILEHRTELLSKAFETAHLCSSTFDVDQLHLEQLLKLPQETALLLGSSIDIQDTSPAAVFSSDNQQRVSMHRWRRLLYRAFPALLEETVKTGAGLNRAIPVRSYRLDLVKLDSVDIFKTMVLKFECYVL